MSDSLKLREYALTILEDRKRRTALFPKDIFDEYAWEIMLCIFEKDRPVYDHDLYAGVGCRASVGTRWIDHLEEKRQVFRSGRGQRMVDLCKDAREAISEYLAESLKRAKAVADEGGNISPEADRVGT